MESKEIPYISMRGTNIRLRGSLLVFWIQPEKILRPILKLRYQQDIGFKKPARIIHYEMEERLW
jgi:hypothetical protein